MRRLGDTAATFATRGMRPWVLTNRLASIAAKSSALVDGEWTTVSRHTWRIFPSFRLPVYSFRSAKSHRALLSTPTPHTQHSTILEHNPKRHTRPKKKESAESPPARLVRDVASRRCRLALQIPVHGDVLHGHAHRRLLPQRRRPRRSHPHEQYARLAHRRWQRLLCRGCRQHAGLRLDRNAAVALLWARRILGGVRCAIFCRRSRTVVQQHVTGRRAVRRGGLLPWADQRRIEHADHVGASRPQRGPVGQPRERVLWPWRERCATALRRRRETRGQRPRRLLRHRCDRGHPCSAASILPSLSAPPPKSAAAPEDESTKPLKGLGTGHGTAPLPAST